MALPRSELIGAPVEPMLSIQWFVDMKPLAEPAVAAVENGKTVEEPTIRIWSRAYALSNIKHENKEMRKK